MLLIKLISFFWKLSSNAKYYQLIALLEGSDRDDGGGVIPDYVPRSSEHV